ncbi:hypothetical protein C2G38_2067635 [Gigaspora rosea]|uniref:Uncharacterized protein n=1 Tax=Gigaspora rosea TaxID=44941 RepID=A0A397VS05_9GLOM|nr:hypothetical protein C2G38_2067635 [Gigaspora rosea]
MLRVGLLLLWCYIIRLFTILCFRSSYIVVDFFLQSMCAIIFALFTNFLINNNSYIFMWVTSLS